MSVPLISAFERATPLLCFILLGVSLLFPSRDIRTVRDLRREFDALRAENAIIRDDFARTISFLRDYDWSALGAQSTGATLTDAPDGAPSERARVASGCTYTRCRGLDGVRRGNDTWLVGDYSPWGIVSTAYRGGFIADGVSWSFWTLNEGLDDGK